VDDAVERNLPDLSASWQRWSRDVSFLGLGWWLLVATRWATVIAMIVWKRWRHLAVFAGSVALVVALVHWFPTAGEAGSGIPGHPSEVAAALAVTLVGAIHGLVPAGRWRTVSLVASTLGCAGIAFLWVLTRQGTTSEVVIGFAIGLAVPHLGFLVFAPESVFPVTYRRGRTAHLDVTGRRREAVETAVREQLGLDVGAIEPFGQAGSGGSTPLRVTLADGRPLFAKLYAVNHLRADRWYKLGRSVLYGRLEDERSFNSVRRMAEYEDYALRFLRDTGVPTAEPFGFAEITPEREYLLLTGFIDDAVEISEVPITDAVLANAIDVVRSLWDAGVAHRDIKPSNILVQGDRVYLIDAFFCQIRPSAWRQSVDLANMLMTLALGSDVERVYRAALRRFTPGDVAEAFAATHGVTVPSQLRAMVMADERSIPKEFASLAPPRARIPVQRWTMRRLALASALLTSVVVGLAALLENLQPAGFGP